MPAIDGTGAPRTIDDRGRATMKAWRYLTRRPASLETQRSRQERMMGRRQLDTGTDELLGEVRDGVAVFTLNRPQARNALSDRLTPALRAGIAACDRDPEVGAFLITGAGSVFCAGGDVKDMGASAPTSDASQGARVAELTRRQRMLTGALVQSQKPSIAALPGPAAGAGLSQTFVHAFALFPRHPGASQMRKSVNHVIRMNCHLCLEKDIQALMRKCAARLLRQPSLNFWHGGIQSPGVSFAFQCDVPEGPWQPDWAPVIPVGGTD